MYNKKYLKYKQKYLNIKYGGAYDVIIPSSQTDEIISSPPTIKIITFAGETIVEFPTEGFTIETLIASPQLDFYNSVFGLLNDLEEIYSDNYTYEINEERIKGFALQMQGKSCILSIVKITDIYTGGPTINPPEDQIEIPEEIPGIITFNNGELVINLRGYFYRHNMSKLNYLNLASYTHNMIKKISMTMPENHFSKFLKVILPNNPNIEEIGNFFLAYADIIKTINFNNLYNLKTISKEFLASSTIKILDLENNINLIYIGPNSLRDIMQNISHIKLPNSIKIIEHHFGRGLKIPILDLENCINLSVITERFCTSAIFNSIKLPLSIQQIESYFLNFSNIETLDLSNCVNLIEIKDKFVWYSHIKLIKLPANIKKIGPCFLDESEIETLDLENCTNLKSDDIPKDFLKKCKKIQAVKLPPQLQHIMPTLTLTNYTYTRLLPPCNM
jgi:hypothetical protein